MTAFARTSLCAALILTAAHAAAAAPAPAKPRGPEPSPALWKVESDSATIYLFGSVHILPRGTTWKTPIVQRAIDSSDIFYFEMPLGAGEHRAASAASMKNFYLPKGQTLSAMLSPAGKKQLAALAKARGLNMKIVDRMRPWLAGELLAAATGRGPSVMRGVDEQVGSEILLARKTRRYFESGPEQADMSARMGDADGAKGFEVTMADMAKPGEAEKDFKRLVSTWAAGDVRGLENIIATEMKNLPKARKILFDERNAAWVKEIPELLREHRTFFVTVGAGHLAGRGSVVDLLCGKGLKVERVDTKTGNAKTACPPRAPLLAANKPA
jgi:uncharacterized protein YbaP (TraB family)